MLQYHVRRASEGDIDLSCDEHGEEVEYEMRRLTAPDLPPLRI